MTNSLRLAVVVALCLTASLQAQQVQCSLVANSASFEPGLPEPGALATVFCAGIRTVSGIVVAPTFSPLPQQLSGVTILINDYYVAPILAVANLGDRQQVNFQVPYERLLAPKSTLQVLTYDASAGAQNSARIDNLDYPKTGGFFADASGFAFARRVADGSWVTPQNPAQVGDSIAVLGTGFGKTYPPKPVGFPAPPNLAFLGNMDFLVPGTEYNLSQPLRVLNVGPRAAKVSSIGLAPGYLGVDHIVFDVPDGAGSGNVDLNLQAGSTVCGPPPITAGCHFTPSNTSNTVKLPVR
ncbi:MAG: hypothetical protein LAP38_28130 [Acidobacteriia bacterium]|nr:hypothetical protein [Terriglobia bacterium]